MLLAAQKRLTTWKRLVTRLRVNCQVGRKQFGSNAAEVLAVQRIRVLFRVLPKDQRGRFRGRAKKRRSFQEIANVLNTEGVASRSGKPWSARTVYGIIDREGLLLRRKKE